jgi:pSer/pThr/pTyr-binding forkhead associated (FHA) protein
VAEMSLAPGHAQGGIEGTQVIPMGGRDGVRVHQTTAQLVLDTPEGPHAFPVGTSLVTIGRGLNNDLIVEDARVSRQHAQIRYKSRRFFIGDLGSTNGTYVNGTQVTTDQVLHDGDTVSFGGLEMHFYQR